MCTTTKLVLLIHPLESRATYVAGFITLFIKTSFTTKVESDMKGTKACLEQLHTSAQPEEPTVLTLPCDYSLSMLT